MGENIPSDMCSAKIHLCSLIRIFTGHILDSQGCKVASCGQWELIRLHGCIGCSGSLLGVPQKIHFPMLWPLFFFATIYTLSIRTPTAYHTCSKIWTSTIYYPMFCLKIAGWVANSVDPDEMQHSAASHLALHCLLWPICQNTYCKYGNLQKHETCCGTH